MTNATISNSYRKHTALAQLHRWYQIYEEPASSLANQLDILDPGVRLKSGLGEGVGHEAFKTRIAAIPRAWKNAHFVNTTVIDIHADGSIDMTAQLTYLNVGIMPGGAVRTAALSYATKLIPTENILPRFTDIAITQLSEGEAPTFKEAYSENRIKSLLHYWLALIENPARDAAAFAEIFADGFSFNAMGKSIVSLDDLLSWILGTGTSFANSAHEIANFSVREIGPQQYDVLADINFLNVPASKMQLRFQAINNPAERFARILKGEIGLS
jgi:hypothetical protein